MSTTPIRYEFSADGPIEASVKIGGGDLTVSAEPTDAVVVQVAPGDDSEASRAAAADTVVEFSGNRLRVEPPESSGGWIFKQSARLRIDVRLPAESRLRAHTGSADIRLGGPLGSADINSGSGDVRADGVSGDLAVHSGSADLRADRVGGRVSFTSGSGDLSVAAVSGPVEINSASGDIHIDQAQSTVTVKTASGDVRLRSAQGPEVKVTTVSGDVTVGVPTGTGVWLDLNTVSGSTVSHLDMAAAPPAQGAALTLRLRTVSGDITVDRAAARPAPSTVD